jgi:predicted nucleotidyltransferase component of viral defense system
MIKLHWDILDEKRKTLLPNLRFLKELGFYLAGGTALALQIGHRTSVDFDFYSQNEFSAVDLLYRIQQISKKVVLIQHESHTLILKVNGVEISLFRYPYSLLRRLVETEYVSMASLEDIAAMKMVAIAQRGIRRDFVDLYFLMKLLGLKKIFRLTKKKYPPFNEYVGLQSITYFTDAENLSIERKISMYNSVPWEKIKKFMIAEAKKFKESL